MSESITFDVYKFIENNVVRMILFTKIYGNFHQMSLSRLFNVHINICSVFHVAFML